MTDTADSTVDAGRVLKHGPVEDALALAREAMPMEDVEPGVLAGILVEARQSAPVAAPPADRGPGLWERLRPAQRPWPRPPL